MKLKAAETKEEAEGISWKKWSYGVGEEGIREAPGTRTQVTSVVIGQVIPWWLMAARSADITVTKIWLRTYSPELEGVVRRGCVGIPVETGNVLSDAMWAAITHCVLLFVDGPVPDELNRRGLWNLPKLEAVMATAGTRANPPLSQWSRFPLMFDHAALGGVTDGRYILTAYTRSDRLSRVEEWALDKRTRQDLRSILKAGVKGAQAAPPRSPLPTRPATRAVYETKGEQTVVGPASLYPAAKPETQVYTEFGGSFWVTRGLTQTERLLLYDVPEMMIRGATSDLEREIMMSAIQVPGKVLQSAAGSVAAALREAYLVSATRCGKRRRLRMIETHAPTAMKTAMRKRRKTEPTMGVLGSSAPDNTRGDKGSPTIQEQDGRTEEGMGDCLLDTSSPAAPRSMTPGARIRVGRKRSPIDANRWMVSARWDDTAFFQGALDGLSGKCTRSQLRVLRGAGLAPIPEQEASTKADGGECEDTTDADGEPLTGASEELEDPNAKATKNDDSEVRVDLWDSHLRARLDPVIQGRDFREAAVVLRGFLLRSWKRRLTRSYCDWEKKLSSLCWDGTGTPGPAGGTTREAARDCIRRASQASWWSWDGGSRPFFWRWPEDYQEKVKDGIKPWMTARLEPWKRKQRKPRDANTFGLIRAKLDVIRDKGYVDQGFVESLMSFFEVAKGDDDVRMVYDGTASGLNDVLWAPWFPLPTVECLLRALEPGYSMADNDVGEMFHNFMMHEELRKYCGLDVSLYYPESIREGKRNLWERWNRLAMGLKSSPYFAVQSMLIAQEVILGDQEDEENVFHWKELRMNLPGMNNYEPSKAWVCKIRRDGTVAADLFIYVDDIRSSAPTTEEAWRASQRTSAKLGFLGIQDAARKRRAPGKETGAWTGSVVWTTGGEISAMTTQEKWEKTQMCIRWVAENMSNPVGLNLKTLKSYRGFLVYVARTYPSMVPYLKGVHATIDSWRPGRDCDGWKIRELGKRKRSSTSPHQLPNKRSDDGDGSNRDHRSLLEEDGEMEPLLWEPKFDVDNLDEEAAEPTYCWPVPRLTRDIQSLLALTDSVAPPRRRVRMTGHVRVLYGFGDASKQGFGASIEMPDKSIHWRFGQWRLDDEPYPGRDQARGEPSWEGGSHRKEKSSNYRELRNLVEALEDALTKGLLDGREIFMFTDNSTAESAYFKGTSSSELLFGLVLRLRKIEMTGRCALHVIHVAGTRMIWQGTDGLSRGDRNAGVMAGESMLSFVPLHLAVHERSPEPVAWFQSWCLETANGFPVRILSPDDWPTVLGARGTYLWAPPPAAADIAVEYMARAIHKRSNSTHVFLCPRLQTARWLRVLAKATDLMLRIPPGTPVWSAEQHEPLILAISFPLSRDKPWKHGGTPHCVHSGKVLQGLWNSDFGRTGPLLCELFDRAWAMAQV